MDNRKTILMIGLALTAVLCLAAGSAQAKGKPQPSEDTVVRAEFRDADNDLTDRITSDGVGLSGSCATLIYDYVDRNDPCYGTPADPQATISYKDYFLRTVTNKLPTQVDRWLVLDFSDGDVDDCPDLDKKLWDYPGRDPDVWIPAWIEGCVDHLEVRFRAYGPFEPSAQDTEVHIIIDGPDLVDEGKRKERTQWNAKFYLDFVNPLSIVERSADLDTVIIGKDGDDDFLAQLWTVNQRTGKREYPPLGIYRMPFQLTLTRVPQQ